MNENYDWTQRAACGPDTAELFFKTDTRQAKKLCAACPVTASCKARMDELDSGEFAEFDWKLQGVWGGTTPKGRRAKGKKPLAAKRVKKMAASTKLSAFETMLRGPIHAQAD